MKVSIIIPTYNHLDDCLKPCLESIEKYTDLTDIETIVVANGCTDGTAEYLFLQEAVFPNLKALVFDEALGYTKSVNLGIKQAKGEFIVLLNNDTLLLEQEKNTWINMLLEPMKYPQVGMTGPLVLHDHYADIFTMIFFCACIRKACFDKIGLLDEIFSPGGGEDIDFTARMNKSGWILKQVPEPHAWSPDAGTNVGKMPIWHKDNQTFKNIPEYTNYIIKRNGTINMKRYNKHIKLNLGSGGVHIPGYLSVDLKDKRTHILMDATNLDIDDNTVESIIASHLFEHISPYKSMDTLRHWFAKLKPGGTLIMEVPNIEELCAHFITGTREQKYGILNCIYGAVNTTAEGDKSDITAPHLWGWTPQFLAEHVVGAGFIDVRIMPEQWSHPGYNFRLEARKPWEIK